jgi:hypothetical protein
VTSTPHDPDQETLDRDMAERQAGMDQVDDHELARRVAEAGRVDGAQA